ncbi:MAG: 1-deoxy-D-xylulose-5-phosphate synthase [Verrucomicrobiae bacterium]|nr:1-deoxy-D-xylulose-5-phosphate synthase [Verrucomicrobiae bacterium]NNJ86657.1 1-deoxy-D-xylulose-5-phosphate synthase [Akkermansiaceae bacterium]
MTTKSGSFELPELLSHIHGPDDVKALPDDQLDDLCEEIRHTLIHSLSRTGGHLGPNLGVVELTVALHRVFDSPKDKFLFDVSHQGYVHKMLTGRAKTIHTIRTPGGLNGFLLRTESEHDCYGAGHAGTAVSAALGMASARDLRGDDNHVVAVAGDAAFTCGTTLEALNNIEATTKKFMVVLNDNEWSIDRNVGAMAKYFNALQTHPTFSSVRHKAAEFVGKIGGEGVRKFAHKVERNTKNLILPNVLFEKFGLRYYGPIDGHDLPLLIRTFEHLKTQEEPVILHIITEKGRGYEPALENPGKFHGLGTYKVEDGSTATADHPTYSELFGRAVTDFAKQDQSITAITAAMPGGTKLEVFKNEIPERYFDVGIAEEHAALFACGHATQGLKPFLAIYSTFMQRALDMIIHDMALQNLPVRLCMDRGGLSGDDGPTHHGLFDIAYLRGIPNIIHMQPKDEDEFIDMLWTMANYDDGPSAIRYPRGAGIGATPKSEPVLLEIGKGEVIQDGNDVAIISLGHMYEVALETKEKLEDLGHSVALINPRFIKPLDADLITSYAKKCKVVLTMEDHVLHNGFGASVIELLAENHVSTPVERIGWPDAFVDHGKVDQLRNQHGLSSENAVNLVSTFLE